MGTKVFRDPLHGDIEVTEEFVKIIDHEVFQRLKNIKQNGLLHHIYHGMKHSRFEHSLGAYHLATIFFKNINSTLDKIKQVKARKILKPGEIEIDLDLTITTYEKIIGDNNIQHAFCAAALLHDIGHGPLSHTLDELELMKVDKFFEDIEDINVDLLKSYIEDFKKSGKNIINHELVSLYYIDILSLDGDIKQYEFFKNKDYIAIIMSLIDEDFCDFAISRGGVDKNVIKILKPVISGLLDVDRLDYMQRDAFMAGVSYGAIESQRLISSYMPCLQRKENILESCLLIKAKYINIVDHFLLSLYELYTQVYLHRKSIQIGYELKLITNELKDKNWLKNITSKDHIMMTDESFLKLINDKSIDCLSKSIHRKYITNFRQLILLPNIEDIPSELKEKSSGYREIKMPVRPIIKDSNDIWLTTDLKNETVISSWERHSVVKSKLDNFINKYFAFWKNPELLKDIEKIEEYEDEETKVSNG